MLPSPFFCATSRIKGETGSKRLQGDAGGQRLGLPARKACSASWGGCGEMLRRGVRGLPCSACTPAPATDGAFSQPRCPWGCRLRRDRGPVYQARWEPVVLQQGLGGVSRNWKTGFLLPGAPLQWRHVLASEQGGHGDAECRVPSAGEGNRAAGPRGPGSWRGEEAGTQVYETDGRMFPGHTEGRYASILQKKI